MEGTFFIPTLYVKKKIMKSKCPSESRVMGQHEQLTSDTILGYQTGPSKCQSKVISKLLRTSDYHVTFILINYNWKWLL